MPPAVPPAIGSGRARFVIAMITFSMAGNTPLVVQPMVVGAMVDLLGLSERQAGIVASVELSGLTLGILGLLKVLAKVDRATLGKFAVIAIVTANIATCFAHEFAWLLPIRFLSGLGAAAAFCIFSGMASSTDKPEHNFAIVNAASICFSGILTLVAPLVLKTFGIRGIMLTLSLTTSLALLTLPWIRGNSINHAAAVPGGKASMSVRPILLLLSMMLLLYTGHGSIWAYQERIGIAEGLSRDAVGRWLGLSMLIWGVSGSLLARISSLAIGRIWPQIISLGTSCFAVLLLVFGSTPIAFGISSGLIAFSWFYGLPYQMGLLAIRDPKGRAAVSGTMMSAAGMAAGPACAAALLSGGSHWPIGVFAGICYLCALGIAIPSARSLSDVRSDTV